MHDKQLGRVLNIRQAAVWLGCSPAYLLRVKRAGWLPTAEEIEAKADTRREKARFYLWQLERLVWDIAFSLSLYDIAYIRKAPADHRETGRQLGVPHRVVQVVREALPFGFVEAVAVTYAGDRDRLKELDRPPSLPVLLPVLSRLDREELHRGSTIPPRTLSVWDVHARASNGKLSAPGIFSQLLRGDLSRKECTVLWTWGSH